MFKIINIAGEDYKMEYSIEASLCSECVSGVMELMAGMAEATGEMDLKKIFSEYANIPQLAISVFYAGLLEHHGDHEFGDGKVPDMKTAKRLVASYLREHKDDENGNFYSVLNECMEKMGEDGFFSLIGVDKMFQEMTPEEQKEAPKKPQDHKKKATKTTEK